MFIHSRRNLIKSTYISRALHISVPVWLVLSLMLFSDVRELSEKAKKKVYFMICINLPQKKDTPFEIRNDMKGAPFCSLFLKKVVKSASFVFVFSRLDQPGVSIHASPVFRTFCVHKILSSGAELSEMMIRESTIDPFMWSKCRILLVYQTNLICNYVFIFHPPA